MCVQAFLGDCMTQSRDRRALTWSVWGLTWNILVIPAAEDVLRHSVQTSHHYAPYVKSKKSVQGAIKTKMHPHSIVYDLSPSCRNNLMFNACWAKISHNHKASHIQNSSALRQTSFQNELKHSLMLETLILLTDFKALLPHTAIISVVLHVWWVFDEWISLNGFYYYVCHLISGLSTEAVSGSLRFPDEIKPN